MQKPARKQGRNIQLAHFALASAGLWNGTGCWPSLTLSVERDIIIPNDRGELMRLATTLNKLLNS